MPQMFEANTNPGEGSDGERWGGSSIDLESLQPEAEVCTCGCGGDCSGRCTCSTRTAQTVHLRMEGSRVHYPGQGGNAEILPSQPVNIPESSEFHGFGESYQGHIGLDNNSVDASHPLTHSNLLKHTAHSLEYERPSYLAHWPEAESNEQPHVLSRDQGMEDFLPTGDLDEMSLDGSMEVGHELTSKSATMSMLSKWSQPLTRSSPNASVIIAEMRHSYISTPLRLVPECSHAQVQAHLCGCYHG